MTHASVGNMFVEHLVARVPELATVRDEHIRAIGEVFPHMILPDVARFITARSQDVHLVDAVLGFLEEAMDTQEEYIVELIGVSFLEGMDPSEASYDALTSRMGPHLRAELALSRGLWK